MDIKALLDKCNETELIESARKQGLGRLRRGIPKEELVQLVLGELPVREHHLSRTNLTRYALAEFIGNPEAFPQQPNSMWGRFRSQLPNCNGICMVFNCTEGRHMDCYSNNEHNLIRPR